MEKEMITPGALEAVLANPSPSEPFDIVVQVVDLKPVGSSNTRFTFFANDGKMKLKAMLPTSMAGEVISGKLQNLGLIRIAEYTCNNIQNQRVLIVIKCEVISPALDAEISEIKVKPEENEVHVKPEVKTKASDGTVSKSAAQIVHEHGNAAPAARLGMSRRVYPLVSLNPYQGNWTIKVRVTNKGPLRTFRNARGEGSVFNVELTDEDGTQIQATMFKEAADKFWNKFELGKVYYISKGTLRVANKQFKTVANDYEMTLHANSEVEEAVEEGTHIPEFKYNFVKVDELGPYVNSRDLVDVIGVVQSVSPVLSIRRKSNNEEIPKRDITIADESKKTVVVSLWNDLAKKEGQELLDNVDNGPIIAVRAAKVSDFSGVSLSTTGRSTLMINPDLPVAQKLRSWYDTDGKGSSMASVGSTLPGGTPRAGSRSLYSERAFLSQIIEPSVGEGKPAYFNVRVYISFIKPDQPMWYRACKTCNRKVTEEIGSGYWCEGCQKHETECSLRYIMVVKASDSRGEAWLSVFSDQAEQILRHTADELAVIRSEETMARRPVDPEEELRLMVQEVRGYVEAVLNSLAANVPKAVVLCQVEKAKDEMLTQLYSSVSAHSTPRIEELLQEDQNAKRKRERYQKQASLLAKLTRQLSVHDTRASSDNWSANGGSGSAASMPVSINEDWRVAFDSAANGPSDYSNSVADSPRISSSSNNGHSRRLSDPGQNGDMNSSRRTPNRLPPPPPGSSVYRY